MVGHVPRRAPGIDFDNDREQSGEHASLARGAEIEPAVAADSGEPGVALAGANAVAVVSQAPRRPRAAARRGHEGLIALDPAVNELEFVDDAALRLDDIVTDD